jgi:adenylate kinase
MIPPDASGPSRDSRSRTAESARRGKRIAVAESEDRVGINVIMLGPPGAGKGTQAGRFAAARGLLQISTGDILRDAVKAELPVALAARALMDRGELVDDQTMIAIVRERLLRPDSFRGFVLDGFPRTVAQACALDAIMAERLRGPLIVVDLSVPEAELVRRLAGRRICATCGTNADQLAAGAVSLLCGRCGGDLVKRADDDERVVRERLTVYRRLTKPLVDFYRDRPTFRIVNGAQSQDGVANELEMLVDDVVVLATASSFQALEY